MSVTQVVVVVDYEKCISTISIHVPILVHYSGGDILVHITQILSAQPLEPFNNNV